MKDKLIIIGASYLQVPLIEKANEMGLETHVFAWEEGAAGKDLAFRFYPVSILEKEKILDFAKTIKPQGIISIGSDLAMHTVNYVASNMGLVGNSMECTELTTNKFSMRKALSANGLPCPAFQCYIKGEVPVNEKLIYPLIVKPTDRSGSRGVTRVESDTEFVSAIERAWVESLKKEAIAEEFIEGREISVEMISWKGEHHYLACTDKVTSGPPYFVELEHHEPADLSRQLEKQIVELTKRALTVLKIENGASHTEVIITPENKLFFVETGARMGGDHIGAKLVKNSTGYDFLRGVIEISAGKFSPVKKDTRLFSGIYYLKSQKGVINNICWRYPLPEEIVEYEFLLNKGDAIRSLHNSADRIGYIIYSNTNNRPELNVNDVFSIEYEKN